ncbi:hypothetical protein [Pontixanthobacter sp.]|uniref:hypothetical protein n=1 Tax=Pontixanthobacter sp. TaxID=2792078 RepID=UPI003C7C53EC
MTTPENPASRHPPEHTLAEEFAAAVAWWKEAGVDHDFADDATDWLADTPVPADSASAAPSTYGSTSATPLAPVRPLAQRPVKSPPQKIGGNTDSWPSDLAAFQQWWLSDPSIDDGGAFPVVGPTGNAGCSLMVIVADPEESDTATLLSGRHGQLLTGMMRAAGTADDAVYTASVLRRHTPMPDWAALSAAGIGDVLLHHVRLAAPKRIVTFGRNIPPLLGNDTAQGTAILQNVNHDGESIPAMGAGSLAELLRSAGRRQKFWQRWLEWTQ